MLFKHPIPIFSVSLVISLLLSGCNFQRVHQHINTDDIRASKFVIKIQGVQGYIAYKMKRDLETNLAAFCRPTGTYLLDLNLAPERTEISYGKDATILRAQERLKVSYAVRKLGSAEPIYQGTSSLAGSFNVNPTEEFSTMTTRKAAMDRVIITLSEEIARDIAIHIQ